MESASQPLEFCQGYEHMKTNLKIVWECVLKRIQENYDLSGCILDQLVITYRSRLDHMYQECRTRIREQLGQPINRSQTSWDRERCGYLLEQYANGGKRYCNIHKYEHHACDHIFVCKDSETLQEELHLTQRQRIYQEHLSGFGGELYQQMEQSLLEGREHQTYSLDQLEQVDQWLQTHPAEFKSMQPIDGQIHVWGLRKNTKTSVTSSIS